MNKAIFFITQFAVALCAVFYAFTFTDNRAAAAGDISDDFSNDLEHCLEANFLQQGTSLYDCIGLRLEACMNRRENQNTTGMMQCNYKERDAWDILLNRYYQRFAKAAFYSSLQQVQRQWIKYRDQKCAIFEEAFDGGSLGRVIRASCLREETARRAIDLYLLYTNTHQDRN